MNMLKQTALATVLVTILSGCGLIQNHVSSPQTDLVCGTSPPTSCKISHIFDSRRKIIHRSKAYEANGVGWLCSDIGQSPIHYCVEEGSSIRFPDGHLVEGPAKGTYEGK